MEVCILHKSAWLPALDQLLTSCALSALSGIFCCNLHYTEEFYYKSWKHLHQPLPKDCKVFHNAMLFPEAAFTGTPSTWHIAWLCILCQHRYWSSTLILSRSHIFLTLMWLLCNWSNICFCNVKGTIICLPLITTPYIIARSCLFVSTP